MQSSKQADTEISTIDELELEQQAEESAASSLAQIGRWSKRVRVSTWPLRHLWLDVDLENEENVPSEGGVILAANHLSFIDSLLLMYSLPRRVTFLGKAEYLDSWTTRTLFPAAGMIPVDRSGRGIAHSLAMAEARLDAGEVVGIFPEGSRSRNGLLHRGHPGVAHLALSSGAPIVPIGIVGTDQIQPPGKVLPEFRGSVTLKFGSPLGVGPWADQRRSASAKRDITEEVMDSIASLTGQLRTDDFIPVPDRTM